MFQAPSIRHLLPVLAAAGACLTASPAGAQTIEDLQKQDSRYIDWLKEYKAAQVLEHYADAAKRTGHMNDKAKVSIDIAVAATKIEALYEVARQAKPEEQAKYYKELRKATEDLLAAKRERVEKFGDDDSALAWQTELLSDQIETYLRLYRNNAVAVYEFGSPDADQAQGFAEVMPVAYQTAVRAAKTADAIQRRMMADRMYIRMLTRSGLRNKIEDGQAAAKYWLGATSYWMTLLPDSHPYFANLGKAGGIVVPGQKATPAEERKRLLAVAAEALRANESAGAKALYAGVLLGQGKTKEAAQVVAAINLADYTDVASAPLAARVIAAKAKVAAAAGKRDDAVRELRAQAAGNPAILAELKGGSGLSYLFVCDAAYRLLLDASNAKKPQDIELFNKAFLDPYADIFSQKAIAGADEGVTKAIQGLRPVLQQRWAVEFANVPADKKPGFLVLQTLDVEFGQIFAEGGAWASLKKAVEANETPDPAKVKEATAKLRHVEESITIALGKEKVSVIRAKLLNQRALARVLGAQAGIFLVNDPKTPAILPQDQTIHAAAMDWLELADKSPESGDALASIDYASAMLHTFHEHNLYVADYEAAAKVLFAKYAKTKAAVRELPYFAGILERQGRVKEALEKLGAMPKDDEFYFPAQQKGLALLERIRKSAQGAAEAKKGSPEASAADAKFAAATDAVVKAAAALEDEAKKAAKDTAPGYRRASARFVLASTLVMHANALAAKGAAAEGVALLENFETAFNPETLLLRDDFAKEEDFLNMRKYLAAQVEWAQVSRLRMLMDAGQGDQVKKRALDLLGSGNPNSLTILKGLLRDIKGEVDRLTSAIGRTSYEPVKREMIAKRQTYGQAMLDLTGILRGKLLDQDGVRKEYLDQTAVQVKAATGKDPDRALLARQSKEYLDLLLVQAKSASGDTAGAVAEVDRLVAAEKEAASKGGKDYQRSLQLLLVASQTYFDHGMSFVDPASPERKSALLKANKNAHSIVENFKARGPGPDGFETVYYEALWTELASLEALPNTGKIAQFRANIPAAVDDARDRDPKGFEALPWNDRFIDLKDRMVLELQNAK